METQTTGVKSWCSSEVSLAKLVAVVYNDACPEMADAGYLYGEEQQNEELVLARGGEILAANAVKQMLFPGNDGVSLNGVGSYSWRKWEKRLLESAGSRSEMVCGIPIADGTFWHTHIEAGKLIHYAAAQGIKTLFVTAVTPHQIRAFVETVWAITTGCNGLLPRQDIRVWSNPPRSARSWHTPTMIAQTQSGGEKPMIDTIADELDRMERYWKRGDLVTCEEVLAYLAWRDS